MKVVLKCIITARGEQFVTMDSLTQQQQSLAILLVSGTYITYTDVLVISRLVIVIFTCGYVYTLAHSNHHPRLRINSLIDACRDSCSRLDFCVTVQ